MKKIDKLLFQYQHKIFYAFLALLLLVGAMLPALASDTITDPYSGFINQALTDLDNEDIRAAQQAFHAAQKQARQQKDKDKQQTFRDCIKKTEVYPSYFSHLSLAEESLTEENYKATMQNLMAAREQIEYSLSIPVEAPAFIQFEEECLQNLTERLEELEIKRTECIQKELALGNEKIMNNLAGEALDHFRYARSQTFVDSNENSLNRIGERILKAEYYYEIYLQLNLGRRYLGYRQYDKAKEAYQTALKAIEGAQEIYFPELENYDREKKAEILVLINKMNR